MEIMGFSFPTRVPGSANLQCSERHPCLSAATYYQTVGVRDGVGGGVGVRVRLRVELGVGVGVGVRVGARVGVRVGVRIGFGSP